MTLTDVFILIILVAVVGIATAYIIRAKRSGARCIGCPDSKTCAHRCEGCTGNCTVTKNKK